MPRAEELAPVGPLSFLISLPSEPQSRAQEGLAACSWPPQQRAPEQSSGWPWEGAAESMDSPPCSQVSRSQVLFTGAQVCLSMCAPMWVCASVYSRRMLLCGHVHVGTRARLPACVLGGIYSHVFAHFLFAHASTTVVLVHSCVHAGVCMLCAWVSLVGLVRRKLKNY